LTKLRAALPGIRLVQVIHVCGEESIDEARAVDRLVDAFFGDRGVGGADVIWSKKY